VENIKLLTSGLMLLR